MPRKGAGKRLSSSVVERNYKSSKTIGGVKIAIGSSRQRVMHPRGWHWGIAFGFRKPVGGRNKPRYSVRDRFHNRLKAICESINCQRTSRCELARTAAVSPLWHDAQVVTISHLPPGEPHFRAIARQNFGLSSASSGNSSTDSPSFNLPNLFPQNLPPTAALANGCTGKFHFRSSIECSGIKRSLGMESFFVFRCNIHWRAHAKSIEKSPNQNALRSRVRLALEFPG